MKLQKVLLSIIGALVLTHAHAQDRILFVTSNQDFHGNTGIAASNHFEEIVVPYDLFTKAGYIVDFVSPKGGAVPVGYINSSDKLQKQYLYDGWFMDKLEHTRKPDDIAADHYAAIFYSGGGAAMYGVPEDSAIQEIARRIHAKNGVISTICHGTAGIAHLTDGNGASLYDGKKITGYPDVFEKKDSAYYKAFPFSIDAAIRRNGGNFVHSPKERDGFHVVDGRFVTGQDPASAANVANAVIALLKDTHGTPGNAPAKSDADQIAGVLLDYIEGTANGQPDRVSGAFHPDFNLYTVDKGSLRVRSGKEYIAGIKPGEKTNRIGRILSVDVENDAAIAKAEIVVPNWRTFTDYFLLLKYDGHWRIVQKSYSSRAQSQ